MNEVPEHVNQRRVDFLNPMNAVGRNDQAVVCNVRKAPTVLAGEGDRHEASASRRFEGIYQIGGFAARADCQSHVAGLTDEADLVDEDTREIEVIADGR